MSRNKDSRIASESKAATFSPPRLSADLYLLKFILHDWDDASAVRILTSIRRAMNAGGRVVLIEMRLGDIGEPGFGPLVDVNMMAVTGGRERTRDEYQKLLAAADLARQGHADAIAVRYLRGRGCLKCASPAPLARELASG